MLKKMVPVGFVLLGFLLAAPVSAMVGPDGAEEMEVDSLDAITGFLVSDQFLASRLKLRKIDREPVPELITIALDKKKKPFVRERAIKCMSLFRDKRVQTTFAKMLKQKPDRYFNFIVMSYLEAFGEDGVNDIKPFLKNSSPQVRLTVVKALGLFGGQSGFELLQAHDKGEQNPQVLATLRTYTQ